MWTPLCASLDRPEGWLLSLPHRVGWHAATVHTEKYLPYSQAQITFIKVNSPRTALTRYLHCCHDPEHRCENRPAGVASGAPRGDYEMWLVRSGSIGWEGSRGAMCHLPPENSTGSVTGMRPPLIFNSLLRPDSEGWAVGPSVSTQVSPQGFTRHFYEQRLQLL